MFRRTRHQRGSLDRVARRNGPDVWEFRWYETNAEGLRIRRKAVLGTVEDYPTDADAETAADALRASVNEHNPRQQFGSMTFELLWEHYKREELKNKSKSTRHTYENYAKNWITPRWATCQLREIRTIPIQKWLDSLDMANGSKAKIRNIMSGVFSHAIRWEFVQINPITGPARKQGVRQSQKRQKVPVVLTVTQSRNLIGLLKPRERVMVLLAVTTGLRISELAGLRWQDVDFAGLQLNVGWSWVLGELKEVKTEASEKPLPIDSSVAEALMMWRQSSAYADENDFVFASPKMAGKQPFSTGILFRRHVIPYLKQAGIEHRIGWHTFRRTVATLLTANGEDVKTVQELLRHANPQITMQIYSQAVTEAKRAANAKVTTMIVPRTSTVAAQVAIGPLTDPQQPQNAPHLTGKKQAEVFEIAGVGGW
ncbi:MAG TPA: tyrosine-type recombinase/integrase [Candidatus Angelobacter sp.]|nr:tyrosine-type recombinase/integrase [Candidatus Angelobacter sp.]